MSALNAKDTATMESLIADDFVDNDAMPGMAPGRQGMIDIRGVRRRIPGPKCSR